MTYHGISVSGDLIDLGNPLSMQIDREEETPADSLIATFPFYSTLPEIKEIQVKDDDGSIFFDGVVDEQKMSCDINGTLMKFSARSKAAHLLDNEALPQVYYAPSLKTIFERHIKDYGFSNYYGNSKSFAQEFYVTKGMSEWDVLEKFCALFLNTVPRVTKENIIDASGESSKIAPILLSNYGDGQQYFSISKTLKRCKLISEVLVRASEKGSYDLRVCDQSLINRDINKKRYLNAVNDARMPVYCGENLIAQSKKESEVFIVKCPQAMKVEIGQKVTIKDKILGTLENLFISQIRYSINTNGEVTEITMYREDV